MIYLFVTAYLLGAFSPAHLITRWRTGQNIRDLGSRNAGATNVAREVGFHWGVLVLLLDVAKGVLAIVLARAFFGGDIWTLASASFGVVIGHNWPLTLRFRGGRGVAAYVGVWLAILPLLTVTALALSGAVLLLTRRPVLMVATGVLAFNALVLITGQALESVSLCLALSAFLVATHLFTVRQRIFSAVRERRWLDILDLE